MSALGTPVTQDEVDTVLRRGILFSILWLAGIGSAIAVHAGLKARRLMRESGGSLQGAGRAWWCLVVGGLGLAFWIPILVVGFANQF